MARKARAENRAGGRDRPAGRWLVDGMNLIGSRPDRWWNDPDRAVRRLIEELDRYGRATGEDVTVVFDRRPQDVSPGSHGAVTVAFASRRGRNAADDEIAEMVGEDEAPHSLTVVTSDRGLIERVRARRADVASATSFRRRLDAALKGKVEERPRP
jgi:predicted RNA-binding protein with PIN domain